MQFSQYVNIDSIIEKINRDYESVSFSRSDAVEWAWECMGKIGTPSLLRDQSCILEVKNWRGVLPPDFYRMRSVRTYHDKIVLNETYYEFWRDYGGYKDTNKTISDGTNTLTLMSDDYNNWEAPASHTLNMGEIGRAHV